MEDIVDTSAVAMPGRWAAIDKLVTREGPLAVPGFEPSPELRDFLMQQLNILVIGSGGLGCELLKDLALCGFSKISVIDMDTIDVSNLNRQFLFREKDVGSFKAEVAAKFVMQRVPGCTVTAYNDRIEAHDADFYRQFQLVVMGLDSIVARRWMNGMLLDMLEYDEDGELDRTTMIPVIDGGTEGFKGNARVIFPGINACVECTLDLYPPRVNFPMCTIAHTPRLPEHCIEYAKVVLWPKEKPDTALDGDDPDHIKWLLERAEERANLYGILGVTYRLTQGVVKNIIPAVASTNAVIAATCANEAFKVASSVCPYLNNYMVFNDADGIYTYTFEYEKKACCLACSNKPVRVEVTPSTKLQELIDILTSRIDLQLRAPGLSTTGQNNKNHTLYMQRPAAVEEMTRPNLDKTLAELEIVDGQTIFTVDPSTPRTLRIQAVMPA